MCCARAWCRRAAHSEPFDVQHLNSRTVPGTFASACYTSAYYNEQPGQSVVGSSAHLLRSARAAAIGGHQKVRASDASS